MQSIKDSFKFSRLKTLASSLKKSFDAPIMPLPTGLAKPPLTLGRKARDMISWLGSLLSPIIKYLLPNFIHFHYFYIISMGLITSIMVYGPGNIKYIDCFFMGYGAVTQAGLNSVDVNDMSLYQQLAIYAMCTLTTPIFIHSGLIFVRLYWFERRFDNIKSISRDNFHMRRNATLAARTMSLENRRKTIAAEDKEESSNSSAEKNAKDIRFSMPKPTRTKSINPTDMYMSIAMMRQKNNEKLNQEGNDEEAGPVLYVPGPAEAEQWRSRGKFGIWNKLKMARKSKREDDQASDQVSAGMSEHSVPLENLRDSKRKLELSESLPDLEEHPVMKSEEKSDDEEEPLPVTQTGNSDDEEDPLPITKTPNESSRDLTHYDGDDDDASIDSLYSQPDSRTGQSAAKNSSASGGSPKAPPLRMRFEDNKPVRRTKTKSKSHKITSNIKNTLTKYPSILLDDLTVDNISNRIKRKMSGGYLSFTPTFGRNSTFVPLDNKQKEELGGVEYRSTKLLAKLLVSYYIGFHLLAFAVLGFWIIPEKSYKQLFYEDGFNAPWWSAFTAASFFNDLGLTLTPDSFSSFVTSRYVLLWGSFFITIGNVAFPVALRFIIWVLFKLSRDLSLLKESLGFLLDHPRRCFTLLFPSIPTWWLFFVLVTLNVIDLVLFCILDLHDASLSHLSSATRVLAAYFQAISTRTAGFTCISLSDLHPAIQVSYMLMMYVSALPVAISIRRTNVYEEQSLGIYSQEADDAGSEPGDGSHATKRFIGAHLRRQLQFDLWYIFLGLFIICICESKKIRDLNDPYFSIFSVLFEVVSAYGCVGLSLGYPDSNTSFSAQFTVVSKLVIVAMFIRGRHRGLPYLIDRAIILPSLTMDRRDGLQANHARRNSGFSKSETSPNLDQWNRYHIDEVLDGAGSGQDEGQLSRQVTKQKSEDDVGHEQDMAEHKDSLDINRPATNQTSNQDDFEVAVPRRNTIKFNADTSFSANYNNYQS